MKSNKFQSILIFNNANGAYPFVPFGTQPSSFHCKRQNKYFQSLSSHSYSSMYHPLPLLLIILHISTSLIILCIIIRDYDNDYIYYG